MRVEVMEHYGLTKPPSQAGFFETSYHTQLLKYIKGAIPQGRLIVVCGVVGSGKTVTMRRLQQMLKDDGKVTVSKSVSVEKQTVDMATLVAALFYDLSSDKQPIQIPKKRERRDRDLQELLKKGKRPVALFVDEAHDLNRQTLTELKRLIELAEDGGGRLSVILYGHPKLRNDLRKPTMEEIGFRTDEYSLDGIAGSQREYINWLLDECTQNAAESEPILTPEAINLLATRLKTPLQIQLHLTLALEAGKDVTRDWTGQRKAKIGQGAQNTLLVVCQS